MAGVLETVFEGTDGPVLAATPTGSLVRPLAQVADDLDDPPPVELFTTEQSAKDLRGQAPVATKVAELLASDDDPVQLLPSGLRATAVVTPDDVVAIARTADQAAGLPAASSLASSPSPRLITVRVGAGGLEPCPLRRSSPAVGGRVGVCRPGGRGFSRGENTVETRVPFGHLPGVSVTVGAIDLVATVVGGRDRR